MPVSDVVSDLTAGVALRSTGGSPSSAVLALGTSACTPAIVGIALRAAGTHLGQQPREPRRHRLQVDEDRIRGSSSE